MLSNSGGSIWGNRQVGQTNSATPGATVKMRRHPAQRTWHGDGATPLVDEGGWGGGGGGVIDGCDIVEVEEFGKDFGGNYGGVG